MQIRVLYFAVFRERLGRDEDMLELPAGTTVAAALAELARMHEPIARLRTKFRVAVNQEFSDETRVLEDGNELALIPPVAGGSGRHVLLIDQPLSLDRCVAAVSGPAIGGIVTFSGTVRVHNHDAVITHLDYSAYEAMAVKEMTRLCDEVEALVPEAHVAVEHRIGRLQIGELAVVIAAGAPHRAEAFKACRELIDRLKQQVPIWKKEFGSAGEEWIGLGP
ncbi:MAG: molybdopterin converting factor subunit 1 [Kofleriaceae bacterium]